MRCIILHRQAVPFCDCHGSALRAYIDGLAFINYSGSTIPGLHIYNSSRASYIQFSISIYISVINRLVVLRFRVGYLLGSSLSSLTIRAVPSASEDCGTLPCCGASSCSRCTFGVIRTSGSAAVAGSSCVSSGMTLFESWNPDLSEVGGTTSILLGDCGCPCTPGQSVLSDGCGYSCTGFLGTVFCIIWCLWTLFSPIDLRKNFLLRNVILLLPSTSTAYWRCGLISITFPVLHHFFGRLLY